MSHPAVHCHCPIAKCENLAAPGEAMLCLKCQSVHTHTTLGRPKS